MDIVRTPKYLVEHGQNVRSRFEDPRAARVRKNNGSELDPATETEPYVTEYRNALILYQTYSR